MDGKKALKGDSDRFVWNDRFKGLDRLILPNEMQKSNGQIHGILAVIDLPIQRLYSQVNDLE
jgi:hypothetical protein